VYSVYVVTQTHIFCLNHWNRHVFLNLWAVRGIRLLHSRLRKLIDTTDSRHKLSARVFVLSLCSFSTEQHQFTSSFFFVVLTGVEPRRPSSIHWLSWLLFCLRQDVSCVDFGSIKSGNPREMTCQLIYNNRPSSAVHCKWTTQQWHWVLAKGPLNIKTLALLARFEICTEGTA
jgi:hypothetical protein